MNYKLLLDLSIQIKSKTTIGRLSYFCEQFKKIISSIRNKKHLNYVKNILVQVSVIPKSIGQLREDFKDNSYSIMNTNKCDFIIDSCTKALILKNKILEEKTNYCLQSNINTINSNGNSNINNNGNNNGNGNGNTLIHNLSELHEGQLVVHIEYGVGRYIGMTILEAGGIKAEYLILSYADNDKVYIPISSLHLITRYISGLDKNAPLHKLGSNTWIQARQKAIEQIRDAVAELLDIHAKRIANKNGFAFCYKKENYQLFCKEFPFELTLDQDQAINAVINDMCQPIAMDRLVCGDVGFGKTEIAMRAAFLAIENHKQVAVLVPTTLLAQQHLDNFRKRFANWPVCIKMISRFCTAKNQAQVLKKTAENKVDILIGTHKLLQDNVRWQNFGLLIIDEEHRFGVRHKEKIKAMRANIDILTLTATPIPRTLNIAMSGMRDLSIIATPPPRRLAVKTFVCEYNTLIIRKAILREILRGGQVFYLYNNVKNIKNVASSLAILVPEARIAIGHGQLRERDLEQVIDDFYHQRTNVLVCTTIIETGIDISNANTIIIEQADHFGLSQLHQLRGRVGRSHRQAYAYLLTTSSKAILNQDACKRLEAISSLENLGAGFTLATHDLEIRGAGALLGEEQSGQIEAIGFSLYMELIERAVNNLKSGHEFSLEDLYKNAIEVELHVPMLLPEEYISDVNMRLSLYKRIASAAYDCEIKDIETELIERFGLLPDPARYLLEIARLRQKAQRLGIRRIETNNKGGLIEFKKVNYVNPTYIINLLKTEPNIYRLDGPTRLRFICDLKDRMVRINYISTLVEKLQQNALNL